MRTLYLDCGMGAAGDMLTAALYELLNEEEKQDFNFCVMYNRDYFVVNLYSFFYE